MNCPPDKIINPKTNRCVSKISVIGEKLLLEKKDLKSSIIKHLTTIRNYENLNKNKYKAIAYSKVLNQLYNYKENILNYDDFIKTIKVGDRIALKVKQLIDDGIIKYEEEKIKKDVNFKIQTELKKIYGIGDAKIKELIDKGIKSINDLEKNKHLLKTLRNISNLAEDLINYKMAVSRLCSDFKFYNKEMSDKIESRSKAYTLIDLDYMADESILDSLKNEEKELIEQIKIIDKKISNVRKQSKDLSEKLKIKSDQAKTKVKNDMLKEVLENAPLSESDKERILRLYPCH